MEAKRSTRTVQSILLLAGAFTFAFLLGELIHDSGHYFCHLAYGISGVGVHFDPFGGTHISGADGLSVEVLGITSVAGPLSNLVLSLVVFTPLWKIKRPILLPLVIWGPVAMIQEGVTFSLGLLTPGGDAQLISALGVPQFILLIIGITLLVAGLATVILLLPLAGLEKDDPPRQNFFILLVGMGSLMLIRSLYSFLMAPGSIMENLIPLLFSILLSACAVMFQGPVTRIAGKYAIKEPPPMSWLPCIVALILGSGMFGFQILVLN